MKKLGKSAGKVVKNTVKPAIQLVKNNGPLIVSVGTGLIGGGPVGVATGISGLKVGSWGGLAFDTALKACVPKNSLKISCTSDSVK